MPKVHLTDKAVKALKPGAKQVDYWDTVCNGLLVRVSPGGKKSYCVVYRNRHSQRRRFNIGDCGHFSLSDARLRVREVMGDVARGNDPVEAKQRRQRSSTFADLCEDFMRLHAERNLSERSIRDARYLIERWLKPRWGHWKVQEIRRSEVIALIKDIGIERGCPTHANRVRGLVSHIFSIALEYDLVEQSPCAALPKKFKEPSRERFLTDAEIVQFWHATEPETPVVRDVFRLLLLLGQRPGETMSMEWTHLRDGIWYIPSGRTKNRKEQAVPLPRKVLALLAGHRSNGHKGIFVARGDQPIKWLQKAKCRIAARMIGVPSWRPYDLRRTLTTGMDRLAISDAVIASVLNHSKASRQGVTAVYARHPYLKEKGVALERWCNYVYQLVKQPPTSPKITPRRRETLPWSVRDASARDLLGSSFLPYGNVQEFSLSSERSEHGIPGEQRANSFSKRGSGVGRAIENDAMASVESEAVSITSHVE